MSIFIQEGTLINKNSVYLQQSIVQNNPYSSTTSNHPLQMDNPIHIQSPDDFIQSISSFSFQQKYFKWQSYLKQQKQQQSQYYQASLQKFVQYYPFNHTYWSQLLDMMLKMPKGKANTLKMYQVALAKNPRCITLWKKFLDWLKKELIRSDPVYLRGQLENASKIVGNHYKAGFVFEYYIQLQPSIAKKYQMLKKAMVSPLQDIDNIRQLYINLIDSQQFSQVTLEIAELEEMSIQQVGSIEETKRILQEQMKRRVNNLYQPTKLHVQQRQLYEKKITLDEYVPYADSIENWRQYIGFIRQSGNSEFLPSIYERALINQCDNQALWEQYFLLLQNEGNHQRALYLLRFHSLFFRHMSKQLIYYWLQIQQRQSPAHSRQLYIQLEQTQYDLELFMKHIQMEQRSKQYNNAKAIFQAILTIFTTNLSIVTHTVLEYADFSVRYFRDIAFAKKLIQTYFKSYPFSQYMYIGILQFYQKNVEYKEGTKEAKEIADEFIQYMLLGLKKAYETLSEKEYKRVKKVANFHMRSYIFSIYLIKGAERKIKEQELQLKKQSDSLAKRVHPGQNGNGQQISLPQKRTQF